MNLSSKLKTSCDVYRETTSGPPLNTKEWTKHRTIKVLLDTKTQSVRYNDDGKVINADALLLTFWTSDLEEKDRYLIGSKYYDSISLTNPNELGLEARILLKRRVGGVDDN